MFSKPRPDILKTSVVDITGKFILFIHYNLFEIPPNTQFPLFWQQHKVVNQQFTCKLPVYTCKMAVYNLVFQQFTLPYIQIHLFLVHIYCTIFTIVCVIFIVEAYWGAYTPYRASNSGAESKFKSLISIPHWS